MSDTRHERTSLDLFEYQEGGVAWLSQRKYGLLADEMGLGKSAQAIRAADTIGAAPILILCPAVARLNWIREWQKFSSRTLTCHALLTSKQPFVPLADVMICSYDLTSDKEILSSLCARRWAVCIADEAHYLKELTAQRTKNILGKNGIVHKCDRFWLLSGTPAPNHQGEIWAMLYVFGVTKLDRDAFYERYTEQKEVPIRTKKGGTIWRTAVVTGKNIHELRQVLAPFMLRRLKRDVMPDLPKILFTEVVVEGVDPPQHKWEQYFAGYILRPGDFYAEVDRQTRVVETLFGEKTDALEVIEQKVPTMRQWIGLRKVPAIVEIIRDELARNEYEKVVVFGVHRAVLQEIRNELRDFGAVLVYGGTPATQRDKFVKKFQEDPACRVFVGNVQAAGTAITLTAAHNVVFAEADWSPANNAQAAMRVHRIGQTKPVLVRFMSQADSIDEKIQRVLKNKTKALAQLFDD